MFLLFKIHKGANASLKINPGLLWESTDSVKEVAGGDFPVSKMGILV